MKKKTLCNILLCSFPVLLYLAGGINHDIREDGIFKNIVCLISVLQMFWWKFYLPPTSKAEGKQLSTSILCKNNIVNQEQGYLKKDYDNANSISFDQVPFLHNHKY